eukprot:gene1791-933_t
MSTIESFLKDYNANPVKSDKLGKGDHICFFVNGTTNVWHHGIYMGENSVCHNYPEIGIELVPLSDFMGDISLKKLHRIDYEICLEADKRLLNWLNIC